MKIGAFFIVMLVFVPLALTAQEAEQLREQISQQQQQLQAINKEIELYEKELVQIGGKRQTLQTEVNQLDVTLKKTTAQVNATQKQISTTELEIQELDGEIKTKEQLIAINSNAIGELMRTMHASDELSLVENLLSEESLAGVWDETESMLTLQESMRAHVQALLQVKETLADVLDKETEKKKSLEGQKQNLAAEQKSIAVTKQEQAGLLTRTKSQEAEYQKILSAKKAAKIQFEKALDDLESKLQYTLDPSSIPSAGKGVLRWPLDQVTVTQQFGQTTDSGRLYSSGTHNGVDFRASVGTPVKAALTGTVVGTGNSDAIAGCYSYGKWVLIKHGNGLSTLYAHLSQIDVGQGQTVATREVIGYSGNTGYSTGPHLHFGLYASDAVQVRQLGTNTPCGRATIPVSARSGYLNPMDYL